MDPSNKKTPEIDASHLMYQKLFNTANIKWYTSKYQGEFDAWKMKHSHG